jgi:precorrin-8X/cobalt-precorrin-8 methylmutase
MDYIRNPDEIYAKSFSIIRAEADLSHLPRNAEAVAVRVIHACGMVDVARDLVITEDFVTVAQAALNAGKPILVDVEMVRQGIIPRLLRNSKVICTLNDPQARELGLRNGTTRSAAAVGLWKGNLDGAVVVIGNAPTALFRLLEMIDQGEPKPAVIVGFPVGFVGAAESKDELSRQSRGIPFAAVRGRKGGSAMASAVINALLDVVP